MKASCLNGQSHLIHSASESFLFRCACHVRREGNEHISSALQTAEGMSGGHGTGWELAGRRLQISRDVRKG